MSLGSVVSSRVCRPALLALLIGGCARRRELSREEDSWSELWMARTTVRSEIPAAAGQTTVVLCARQLAPYVAALEGAAVVIGKHGAISRTECTPFVAPVGRQRVRVHRIGYDPATREVLVRADFVDTLHVVLAANGIPSRASCRAAARAGHMCL